MSPPLSVALTIDDAPSVAGDDVRFDPLRMDRIRELLGAAGVQHCVAFVVGETARGSERALERWLADGFELGNHGEHHVRASNQSPADFERELRACDGLLEAVGAFANGDRRYFRPPFGDRGHDPAQRAAVRQIIEQHGYVAADVTINLYDWCYEPALTRALEDGDDAVAGRILARFRRAARSELAAAGRARPAPGWVDVAALHFGEVTARCLPTVLADCQGELSWCPLRDVVDQPAYGDMLADDAANGILADRFSGRPRGGVRRRVARTLRRLDWLREERLGPVAPRWSA